MSQTHAISNTQLPEATLNGSDRAQAVKHSTAGGTPIQTTSASITDLSGTGTVLSASNIDEVRTEKVAALKSAIDSGTYNVSASAVADKLITHLLG